MRSVLASSSPVVLLGLLSLLPACGGRAESPTDDTSILAPEKEPTGNDGLFLPPSVPGVDRVAEGLGTPSAIALGSSEIVFTTRTTIVRGEDVASGALFVRNKMIGEPLLLSLDGRGAAYESVVVVENDAIVGTNDGRVLVIPLRGGAEKTIVEAEAPLVALGVAGDHVYYATDKGIVSRAPRAGGKAEKIGTVATAVRGIEVDGDAVYVATTGAIVRLAKDGKESFVEGSFGAPCAMVRDGRKLFWTTLPSSRPTSAATGAVLRLALDGGEVQAVVSGAFGACAIASDPSSVWFATTDSGAGLMRAPISGGAPARVTGSERSLTHPGAVAVDATHVYWLTASGVLRSKK